MTDLRWPWLAVTLAVVALALLMLWTRRPRRGASGLPVAHTERFRALPRFRALARREQLVAGAATLGAFV
ncbi:MAG: hypothetical protein WC642_10895, partial [Nocardioides sp.]